MGTLMFAIVHWFAWDIFSECSGRSQAVSRSLLNLLQFWDQPSRHKLDALLWPWLTAMEQGVSHSK